MKTVSVLVIALLFTGCASEGTRVPCDGKLVPINAPAHVPAKVSR